MSCLIILGGKTRLAVALHAAAVRRGRTVKVLCREESERAALLSRYPPESLLDMAAKVAAESIDLVVCALGLAHPARPDLSAHGHSLLEDSRRLHDFVQHQQSRIHVILISTVIALAPPRDRAYYGGYKNLAESTIADALRAVPSARLSVLYPGRLVEKRGGSGLSSWIATSRSALAHRLLDLCDSQKHTSRAVGLDARLWLVTRCVRIFAGAMRPSLGNTTLLLRDGLPRDD